jgi:hypothetical protein
MVQGEGFEPPKAKPADLQSALVDRLSIPAYYLEPTEGFEPTTRCLQNSRSDQLSYVGINNACDYSN